jgi:general secretion pathway protein B
MSYILDALRKSEQERQLAEGKAASALYPVSVASRRATSPWLLMLGVAAGTLAVAGLVFWLLMPRSSSRPEPVPSVPTPVVAAPVVQPAPVPPPVIVQPAREVPVAAAVPRPPVVPATREKPQPAPVAPQEVPAPPKEEALPVIVITGYVRDGEQGGMAMINDRLVREGEEVSPGLRLEKILPDGAIFNFKGRRFTR